MTATDVKIANIALTLLSSSRIMAMDEDSENARKMNAIYEFVRDDMLESHNWNFAKTQTSLAELSTAPLMGWTYAYQLPSDCIRFLRLENDAAGQVYENNTLYTDESPANIEYIKRVTDASTFSKGFVLAFAYRLARDLAYGITQSKTVFEGLEALHIKKLQEAKASDAQAGTPQSPLRSTAMSARGM